MKRIVRFAAVIVCALLCSAILCACNGVASAHSSETSRYVLTFYSFDVAIKTLSINDGETVYETPTPDDIDGYVFDGWYLDQNSHVPFSSATAIHTDLDLYAKWTHFHVYGEGMHSAGDCKHKGFTLYVCTVCGEQTRVEDPSFGAHVTSSEWSVTKQPTCTECGTKVTICSLCGEVAESAAIAPTGHQHTAVKADTVVLPTCLQDGYSGDTVCLDCGAVLSRGVTTRALSHDAEWQIIRDATCSEEGQKQLVCKTCKQVLQTAAISALGHDFQTTIVSAATCTEDGVMHRVCTRCGYQDDVVLSATGCVDTRWVVTKQPTCTATGERTLVCNDCGRVLKRETLEPLGHNSVDGECTRCGAKFED